MKQVADLFKPLDGSSCNFFLYLSIINFILGTIWAVTFIYLLMNKKQVNLLNTSIVVLSPFVSYFVNRLFYSMCTRSLN